MGKWSFVGGKRWENDRFIVNAEIKCDVSNEADRVFKLEKDDLLTPGLIDFHCHPWAPGSAAMSNVADQLLASVGISAYVDGGTFGYPGWEAADRFWRATSFGEVRSLLNIRPEGFTKPENPVPTKAKDISVDRVVETVKKANGRIIGVKVVLGQAEDKEEDLRILKTGRAAADMAETIIAVHITNSFLSLEEIFQHMKLMDVLVHPFHGERGTALLEDGTYSPTMFKMQQAGILIDMAVGRSHLSWKVAGAAFEQGFRPDIITSDQSTPGWHNKTLHDLPHILSACIAGLKMPLDEAFRCVLTKPGRVIGINQGFDESLLLLRKKEGHTTFPDSYGQTIKGEFEYLPEVVIRSGKAIIYPA